MFIVEIEKGVWLAPWKGDPGRTTTKENAKKYITKAGAVTAISVARLYRPFIDAKVKEID
jgi:hypothetical protein